MKISLSLAAVLTFLVAGLLSYLVAIAAAISIENRSVAAVEERLEQSGVSWVELRGDGLQVHISGEAPNEAARFRALTLAAAVVDDDRLIDEITVADPAGISTPDFLLEMLRNSDGISMIGLIPTDADGETIAARIADITNGVEVANLVESVDYPIPQGWDAALEYGLRALRLLPRSKISVMQGKVTVTAVADSVAERDSAISRLNSYPQAGLDVVIDISAPRPVITPFAFRMIREGDVASLEVCSADTEANAARIITAAEAAGLATGESCDVGLGVPSTEWARAIEVAVAALAELGEGTLTFSDADVSLVAKEGTSQRLFDRVVGELDRNLPNLFSLQAILPPSPQDSGALEAPEFTASLSETGAVQVRGRLPDENLQAANQAFAQALFGSENVYFATNLDEALPEGWSVRSLAGLEALSFLHDGDLLITPAKLTLSGRVADRDHIELASRLLSDKLDGADFEINVTVDASLAPEPELLSPETCLSRINDLLAETKITFDPGSIEINESTGAILDRLAEILPDCHHVDMEIGGHTDSQGREEMNLTLSQARADAVLNGLLARRVLVSNLSARGYGEANPIADNDTEEGREQNRRIELKLIDRTAAENDTPGEAADAEAPAGEEAQQ